jgi:hypothetical protein
MSPSAQLNLLGYDFMDFGCSGGGSINFAMKRFKAKKGLGVDADLNKVSRALSDGYDAICLDVKSLTASPEAVSFVTMMDFLEHLPSSKDAASIIYSACTVARDFIFIRQPWFDADGYLFRRGCKLYWSDWSGHTNHMTTLHLYNILSRIPRVTHFRIYGRNLISDSAHPAVHSLRSPTNQHDWDAVIHPQKPNVPFDCPVYTQVECIATLNGGNCDISQIEQCVPSQHLLFDSSGHLS